MNRTPIDEYLERAARNPASDTDPGLCIRAVAEAECARLRANLGIRTAYGRMKAEECERLRQANRTLVAELRRITAALAALEAGDPLLKTLARSALAELDDGLACGNFAHPKIDAAAYYLRCGLEAA
jgi:hypothetical protein